MSHLLEKYQTDMELRNSIAEFSGKLPERPGGLDVSIFLHHTIHGRNLSSSFVNSAYGVLRLYYEISAPLLPKKRNSHHHHPSGWPPVIASGR